ncbi:hypothetical protein AC611_06450 [Xanthomonas phaseoli pv. phaseoli]|nr:hypothetical protein AC609_06445 [Xanthomonas phaseoli pv. phaseoli]AZU25115.1 hypothetical protein AC611_06450 [Xanthomonas phaseoli pv. phaseoli]AZU29478.1 hypothetical protein AC801_06325 [Xanthomonas sp. ISO98C4]AZU33883.1 hypothetical protein AC610_06440 [Xanthomonas phaseoli pv. phaseoli]
MRLVLRPSWHVAESARDEHFTLCATLRSEQQVPIAPLAHYVLAALGSISLAADMHGAAIVASVLDAAHVAPPDAAVHNI